MLSFTRRLPMEGAGALPGVRPPAAGHAATVTAAAALAVLLLAPTPAQAQLSETHTLEAEAVSVRNLVGEVRVVPGSGSRIQVTVVRAGPDAGELSVEVRREGDQEVLRVMYPDDRIVYRPLGRLSRSEWSPGDRNPFTELVPARSRRITIAGSGRGLEAHAEITVRLPAGKRLGLYHAAGEVHLADVEGELDVNVRSASVQAVGITGPLRVNGRSGSVRVDRALGDVRVRTRSGAIQAHAVQGEVVELAARSGTVEAGDLTFARADLSARSGRVRLEGAQGGRLSVKTRSGRIQGGDLEVGEVLITSRSGGAQLRRLAAGTLQAEARSGSIDLDLIRQVATGRVSTRSGQVTVRVPRTFSAELDLQTRGRIRVDVPAGAVDQSRNRFRGRLGDGGARLEVRNRSGGIRIVEG